MAKNKNGKISRREAERTVLRFVKRIGKLKRKRKKKGLTWAL